MDTLDFNAKRIQSLHVDQNSSQCKRKLLDDDKCEHIYSFDIDHNSSNKTFCSRSPTSSMQHQQKPPSLGNYQQTTKIIQEFNIQQSTNTSDITVSSTINIKSTGKPSNPDLLSEADFQRVVQDITPADRDLFDEFLNGIKQKSDDQVFLSSFDDLSSSSTLLSHRQSSFSLSSPTSSLDQRRRTSLPRGSNTIHYSPHAMPNVNQSSTPAAAQTLKQMAVQHQQRITNNHHQYNNTAYSNYPYTDNFPRQYHQQSPSVAEPTTSLVDPTSYYRQTMNYSPSQSTSIAGYQPQHSAMYAGQNYTYQTSTSFYQQPGSTSSYPPNSLPPSTTTPFHCQDDYLPILDL